MLEVEYRWRNMKNASTALVGTFPPTQCGLATFTRSSATALSQNRKVGVVELVDAPRENLASMVSASWVRGNRRSMLDAIATLETFDAVIIEHEFGIFGGRDGDEVLDLVAAIRTPIITVLHTVLERPSDHQRFVIEELARRSDAVVTLTETARRRLLRTVYVEPSKLVVIPHGAHEVHHKHLKNSCSGSPFRAPEQLEVTRIPNFSAPLSARVPFSFPKPAEVPINGPVANGFATVRRPPTDTSKSEEPPVVLTWGLLGPGKGIENAIDAIALLRDMDRPPQYWIVGETHPKVRETSGEDYRESLVRRARDAGVSRLVKFYDGYRDLSALHALVIQANLVVLPYESREQVTSGVLVEAIAAGLPVVATDFPHASELLSQGCGVVVPHDDTAALARAIREVLTNDPLRSRLEATARRIAPSLYWPAVGRSFGALVDRCVASRAAGAALADQHDAYDASLVS